ncbi:MAG TPA: HI0074 family nucleotidyltransferase substrate-binding subunit [Granulicella sp.]|nr:HI0074 family nucleotidyltransferase substrate-binding subunit [Granulicella sp.]
MRTLDFSPLGRASDRLREALTARAEHLNDDFIRDSVVQCFEFSFELAHVLLRRYLEASSANGEEIDAMSFPTLIRTASERGLLRSGWDRWFDFRKARNATSHADDEARAKLTVDLAPEFLAEVDFLYRKLTELSV